MSTLPVLNRADQQKGRFGGHHNAHGRYVTAEVKATDSENDWFRIRLRVFPEPSAKAIEGDVTFYLHQSFPEPVRVVKAQRGEASLTVYAYGAFTVGVVLDGGTTKLELDLSELASAPREFRER